MQITAYRVVQQPPAPRQARRHHGTYQSCRTVACARFREERERVMVTLATMMTHPVAFSKVERVGASILQIVEGLCVVLDVADGVAAAVRLVLLQN